MKHIELMNDMIYFNYDIIPFFNLNDVLNNNEKSLLISNIYKIIISPLLTILTPIVSLLFPLILLFYFKRKTNLNIPITTVVKEYFKLLFSNNSMNAIFSSPSKAMIASLVTKGIYVFMYCQNIYYSLQNSYNTNKIINIIHEKLNKMTQYTVLCKNIKQICTKYNITNLTPFITYNKIDEELQIYEEYFKHSVFQSDPKLFSDKGKILYIFKQFKKNKEEVTHLFHLTGIIDSVLSIEHLLSNSTDSNPYTLCEYLSKDKPVINIKNIWHPFLNDSTTVKNSVNVSNNILITGPNAAGKSTFIKSVIINIIMAQTIGISSCQNFQITPFHLVETYLHIPDSKGSSSLFEAEMFRSKKYIEKMKTLDESKFSFIVLDEIFSSTNYVEGFSGAYSILKKISSFSNTLSITTTHYTDLEVLEKDTEGKVINYKFEVDYDENNEIKFNYLLKRGMSRQYIALDLLKKNGFDDDVIEEAIKMCNKIKENKIFNNDNISLSEVNTKDNKTKLKTKKSKSKVNQK
jgi:DNA mismatch repair ATPase MutS